MRGKAAIVVLTTNRSLECMLLWRKKEVQFKRSVIFSTCIINVFCVLSTRVLFPPASLQTERNPLDTDSRGKSLQEELHREISNIERVMNTYLLSVTYVCRRRKRILFYWRLVRNRMDAVVGKKNTKIPKKEPLRELRLESSRLATERMTERKSSWLLGHQKSIVHKWWSIRHNCCLLLRNFVSEFAYTGCTQANKVREGKGEQQWFVWREGESHREKVLHWLLGQLKHRDPRKDSVWCKWVIDRSILSLFQYRISTGRRNSEGIIPLPDILYCLRSHPAFSPSDSLSLCVDSEQHYDAHSRNKQSAGAKEAKNAASEKRMMVKVNQNLIFAETCVI